MFSGVLIGFIVALSSGTWFYTKTMRRTGNNTQSSITAAGIGAAVVFIVIVTLVATLDSMLGSPSE
jgi:uncharacterized membrane protein YdjX (TVP38/TMEM64 family)